MPGRRSFPHASKVSRRRSSQAADRVSLQIGGRPRHNNIRPRMLSCRRDCRSEAVVVVLWYDRVGRVEGEGGPIGAGGARGPGCWCSMQDGRRMKARDLAAPLLPCCRARFPSRPPLQASLAPEIRGDAFQACAWRKSISVNRGFNQFVDETFTSITGSVEMLCVVEEQRGVSKQHRVQCIIRILPSAPIPTPPPHPQASHAYREHRSHRHIQPRAVDTLILAFWERLARHRRALG